MRLKNYFTILCLLLLAIPIPIEAAAVTVSLSPGSNSKTIGDSFAVSVLVSASTNVNAAECYITFNPAVLEIVSVSPVTSFFNFPMPSDTYILDNGSGLVYFSTGKTVPGTGSGSIAGLNFRAKAAGSSTIALRGDTRVQNLGTTIVDIAFGNSSATVSDPVVATPSSTSSSTSNTQPKTTTPATPKNQKPYAPTVSSLTHPEEAKWYKETVAKISWAKAADVTDFSYGFDQTAGTVPDDTSEGVATSKEFPDLKDGTYFFHVKAKNQHGWGAVKAFSVNVDTKNPDNLNLNFETGGTPLEPIYAAKFEATDALSGIDHYELKIDDGAYAAQISPFALTIADNNEHSIAVKAVDKAGNFVELVKSFSKRDVVIPAPKISEISSIFKLKSEEESLNKEYLIKGSGTAKTKVKIYVDNVEKLETDVLDNGEWMALIKDLGVGKHIIFARTRFGEKLSDKSDDIQFVLGEDGSLVLGQKKHNSWYYLIFIPLLGLIYPAYLFVIRRSLHKKIFQSS
ncbi:TPA: hypothetical protein DDW69_01100 [candidate division CPR2 bacterium]|uniref:S-layer domain protein n=1 Tax=candidate division CPR2 bacterium GW2011_GWC1_41_48 TaxID=1618344 RepID=A0A0G0YJD3_UNCC2|nr:MAG: S-layer domain protein [candidate division CPR2 bacterium GW2011_GWC2_39_35]KKR29466.1 MAG: S-layer domain protein [candidate division CPR2 bacterium GW2011_GWD2_39_7]KKS09621.1 MAG: S-layer domain protein [candidate division CPR2 bacterium GW2011_GWC1_41_48]OGB71694.1 MAG: hypothetical protein A2Y26_03665 [candidate division CPR2 bacterium GWD2_39_7]HBG81416.1 hypothetical protein [candidate division CPR2 bacterium]